MILYAFHAKISSTFQQSCKHEITKNEIKYE